jgi:hypothetical protein
VAQPASRVRTDGDADPVDVPSLDPSAIEEAYRRERARRRARHAHQLHARNSNARFWVMLAVLALITVILALTAFREVQTSFGVFQ